MQKWEERNQTYLQQDSKKEENLRSKYLYKILLLLLKGIPILVALIDCVHNITSYYEIEIQPISGFIGGISLLSWLFMLLASFVFRFCLTHRLPLYYVLVNNIISLIDSYLGIPITDKQLLCLYLIITFIFIILYTYVKTNKRSSSEVYR